MLERVNKMQIKTIAIIGMGALGVMYADHFSKKLPEKSVRVIADQTRIERYQKEGIYSNGEPCYFHFVTPEETMTPADLVIFTVKYHALPEAIKAVKNQVGKQTILMSALNGISSEKDIGEVFGMDKVLYCVAQGMDAVKEKNQLIYANKGRLCFGEKKMEKPTEKVTAVANFFDRVKLPYEVDYDMKKRQWGKLMLNVGLNQTVAVFETDYGGVQENGKARDTMIAAMREVIELSIHEGVELNEEDLSYWLNDLAKLHPRGKPSMRQDAEAKRYSEVELFSGTINRLGKHYGVKTPVNEYLYQAIISMEEKYEKLPQEN